MNYFEVGKINPELAGPERIQFDITGSGAVLLVRFNKVYSSDVAAFKSGRIEIKMALMKNIIFMLFRFGDLPWMDAPYTAHLSPYLSIPDIQDGCGIAVTVILCDIEGRVFEIKLMSFSNDFSKALEKAIIQQLNTEFNYREYNENIANIYSAYTTKNLVGMSSYRMKISN